MNDANDNIELSPEERQALRSMRSDEQPPPRIEDDVVRSLRRDGLLDDVSVPPYVRGRRWWWVGAASAAAAAVLTTWIVLRSPAGGPASPASAGPRFVLLLYGGEPRGSGPSRHDEYAAWARRVAAQGIQIAGEELAEEATEVTRGSGPAEPPVQPRGYFVISARDAETAREIAETCPHLSYGGRVILRRIVP